MLTYSRSYLLELSHQLPEQPSPLLTHRIPCEILRDYKPKRIRRKRGSRGGVRNRVRRRGSRLPLPAITLSNVRSLRNKTEKLSTLLKFDRDYQQSSLFCFTETWLTEDAELQLDGFEIIRFDRDAMATRKSIGGGLCIAVNKSWALRTRTKLFSGTDEVRSLSTATVNRRVNKDTSCLDRRDSVLGSSSSSIVGTSQGINGTEVHLKTEVSQTKNNKKKRRREQEYEVGEASLVKKEDETVSSRKKGGQEQQQPPPYHSTDGEEEQERETGALLGTPPGPPDHYTTTGLWT
ncbi:uncharacterized protein V6R79_020814 [Siganus canaliculatus]